jgi:1,2-dihydroxy-3-keto-5-methylthiopentene dioxygenase
LKEVTNGKLNNFVLMASIKIRNTGERIEGHENVGAFLKDQGVLYEHWNISKLPQHLQGKCNLTDEEKAETLKIFESEIKSLGERGGYGNWDVLPCLNPHRIWKNC